MDGWGFEREGSSLVGVSRAEVWGYQALVGDSKGAKPRSFMVVMKAS